LTQPSSGRAAGCASRPKQLVSLRLDPDLVEKFKRTGKGWQERVNVALRRARI
jgi:uncharacterized protein (DUF4415 family)